MWSTLALLSLLWFVGKTAVGYTTRLIKGKTNTKYAISCYIFILFSAHLFVSSLKAKWIPLNINQGNSSKDFIGLEEVSSLQWVFPMECIWDFCHSREMQLNKWSPAATGKQKSVHRGLTWFCFAQMSWLFFRVTYATSFLFSYGWKRRLEAFRDHIWLWLWVLLTLRPSVLSFVEPPWRQKPNVHTTSDPIQTTNS